MKKTVILSLGGSLIVPDSFDVDFLKGFKKLIESYVRKEFRFVIYCGGGRLARDVQAAASSICRTADEDLDWLGIHATKLNAQLIKTIFRGHAEDSIIDNPNAKLAFRKNIVVAGGWQPGWSTDYDAVLTAKKLGIGKIINMSNVDYIFDKDPKKYAGAKKIENIKWVEFIRLVGSKWKSGMNVPFDPVAAKEAQRSGLTVLIVGKDINNLARVLDGKKFEGTTIR